MLLVRAKFLLDCCTAVVIFVVFATAIVGNSNKRTTNVVGVAGMAEMAERLQMGDRGGWLRPAKETHSSRFHFHLHLHLHLRFHFH